MIVLYHAPRTRSVRVRWLLEELGLPHELRPVEFRPESTYVQDTPLGKLPVLEDGEVVMCESGAIVEYLIERHGGGRLAPAVGDPLRARFLQWLHFAEGTAQAPLGVIVWHAFYKKDAERNPTAIEDARGRAIRALDFLQRELGDGEYLLASGFSAADIMLGFTLVVAQVTGVLGESHAPLARYLERLQQRPAFQRAIG